MLQNEWQPNILDILYQIIFKIIILSQIGADRYKKTNFRNTTFVSPLESCGLGLWVIFLTFYKQIETNDKKLRFLNYCHKKKPEFSKTKKQAQKKKETKRHTSIIAEVGVPST